MQQMHTPPFFFCLPPGIIFPLEPSMLRFIVVVSMCFFISGCASTSAENVGRGMQYGTAGAGIVGLPVFLAGIAVEKTGRALSESPDYMEDLNGETKRRPQFGEYSAGIQRVINQTPTPVQIDKGGQTVWNPRLYMADNQEKAATIDNTPPDLLALRQLVFTAKAEFMDGKFGSDPAQRNKNILAWEKCGQVIAEYKGSMGQRVVVTSTDCLPAQIMLYSEWLEKNAARKL